MPTYTTTATPTKNVTKEYRNEETFHSKYCGNILLNIQIPSLNNTREEKNKNNNNEKKIQIAVIAFEFTTNFYCYFFVQIKKYINCSNVFFFLFKHSCISLIL